MVIRSIEKAIEFGKIARVIGIPTKIIVEEVYLVRYNKVLDPLIILLSDIQSLDTRFFLLKSLFSFSFFF